MYHRHSAMLFGSFIAIAAGLCGRSCARSFSPVTTAIGAWTLERGRIRLWRYPACTTRRCYGMHFVPRSPRPRHLSTFPAGLVNYAANPFGGFVAVLWLCFYRRRFPALAGARSAPANRGGGRRHDLSRLATLCPCSVVSPGGFGPAGASFPRLTSAPLGGGSVSATAFFPRRYRLPVGGAPMELTLVPTRRMSGPFASGPGRPLYPGA